MFRIVFRALTHFHLTWAAAFHGMALSVHGAVQRVRHSVLKIVRIFTFREIVRASAAPVTKLYLDQETFYKVRTRTNDRLPQQSA